MSTNGIIRLFIAIAEQCYEDHEYDRAVDFYEIAFNLFEQNM